MNRNVERDSLKSWQERNIRQISKSYFWRIISVRKIKCAWWDPKSKIQYDPTYIKMQQKKWMKKYRNVNKIDFWVRHNGYSSFSILYCFLSLFSVKTFIIFNAKKLLNLKWKIMPDCCRSSIYYCRGFLSGEILLLLIPIWLRHTAKPLAEEKRLLMSTRASHTRASGASEDTHGPEGPQVHMGVEVGSAVARMLQMETQRVKVTTVRLSPSSTVGGAGEAGLWEGSAWKAHRADASWRVGAPELGWITRPKRD